MQALVVDGVLQIQGRLHLDVGLDTEVLKRNDLEYVADDQAAVVEAAGTAAEAAETEAAYQDHILLITDAMLT